MKLFCKSFFYIYFNQVFFFSSLRNKHLDLAAKAGALKKHDGKGHEDASSVFLEACSSKPTHAIRRTANTAIPIKNACANTSIAIESHDLRR